MTDVHYIRWFSNDYVAKTSDLKLTPDFKPIKITEEMGFTIFKPFKVSHIKK